MSTGLCLLFNVDECLASDDLGNHANFLHGSPGSDWYSFPACRPTDPGKGTGSCPSAGCASCPTSAQYGQVSTYQYPGITHGTYKSHKDSLMSSTQLSKPSGAMPIEACCQACASNPSCLYFSWKNNQISNSGMINTPPLLVSPHHLKFKQCLYCVVVCESII